MLKLISKLLFFFLGYQISLRGKFKPLVFVQYYFRYLTFEMFQNYLLNLR
jgi:hypothetical protein